MERFRSLVANSNLRVKARTGILETSMASYRIGTDIGGTFTDLCVLEEERGEFFNLKVATTTNMKNKLETINRRRSSTRTSS